MPPSTGDTTPLLGSSPDQHEGDFLYQPPLGVGFSEGISTSAGPPRPGLQRAVSETNLGIARLKRSLKRKGGGFGAPRARRLTWLCINARGEKSFMHADKRALIGKVGLSIPIRDMRLLDHNLAIGDSIILVRENAIITSLEHVRLIIMHDKVLIPREGVEQSELTGRFVDVLDEAIAEWYEQKAHFEDRLLRQTQTIQGELHPGTSVDAAYERYDETSSMEDVAQEIEPLPFELVVLEAALKEVINAISIKVADIEQVTMPAMDALMKSVTPTNLECVRKVKTRLQRITGRCEAIRDELERFLQDDEDMDRMCLTRKKEIEEEFVMARREMSMSLSSGVHAPEEEGVGAGDGAGGSHARSVGSDTIGNITGNSRGSTNGNNGSSSQRNAAVPVSTGMTHRRGFLTRQSLSFNPQMSPPMLPGFKNNNNNPPTFAPMDDRTDRADRADDPDADADAHLEVENLLESYFMQVDSMYDKLVALGAYIEDSEEFTQIELDSSRNRLIRFEVILTVATFAIMPFNIVSGMLGENLKLPDTILGDTERFVYVNVMSATVSCFIFVVILWYMRKLKI